MTNIVNFLMKMKTRRNRISFSTTRTSKRSIMNYLFQIVFSFSFALTTISTIIQFKFLFTLITNNFIHNNQFYNKTPMKNQHTNIYNQQQKTLIKT